MSDINSIAIVETFFREVWQGKDPAAVDRLVADDFGITSGGIEIRSRDAFRKWVAAFLASIDDFQFKIVEIFQNAAGDRVVTRWLVTGRNNGFMGSPACGSPIVMTGTAVVHVREDGLLQHNWVERSALEVHRSLAGNGRVA